LKILHVISSVNPKGGGVIEGVKQLCSQYPSLGVSAEIACLDEPSSPCISQVDMPPIHALGAGRGGYSYSSRLVPWLLVNSSRFDAVIVDGIWQYHSFAVWRALAGGPTPYFVFTHGMLDPWFKTTYPLKHLKKWLYWPWADYRVLRDASAVIFTCEEERMLARKSFWLYKANEAVTAYGSSGPIGDGRILRENFFATYPSLRGKRLVLFLSRIHVKKGCDLLISAFARVAEGDPNLHLVMVGPDQTGWASTLKEQANSLGIADRITWTGMLEGEQKWGAYYASEVFCLPSHQENFGIVVAEALACGKPVLISNKVNIWREVEADGAGFVADDTVEGTVQNLRRWLAQTPAEYQAMAKSAAQSFSSRFHVSRAAERLVEIIKETG